MTRFERWSVWLTSGTVAVSGLGFFAAKYLVVPVEPWAVINHPLEPWLLKLHVMSAPLFVFAIGLISTKHIHAHIRARVRRGRRTGMSLVWVLVPMVASGYLLQVVTNIGWLGALGWAHTGVGVLFVVLIAGHRLSIGKRRSRDEGETLGTWQRNREEQSSRPETARARSA